MNIPDPEITGYLISLAPQRSPTLAAMEQYAKDNSFPIIGPLVGRFLQ